MKFRFLIIIFLFNNEVLSFDKKFLIEFRNVFIMSTLFNHFSKNFRKMSIKDKIKFISINSALSVFMEKTIEDFAEKIFKKNIKIEKSKIDINISFIGNKINEFLAKDKKKATIFYGPPGTGKTYFFDAISQKENLESIKVSPKDFTYNLYELDQYKKIFNKLKKNLNNKNKDGVFLLCDEFNFLFQRIDENQGLYFKNKNELDLFNENKPKIEIKNKIGNFMNLHLAYSNVIQLENDFYNEIKKNNIKFEKKRNEIINFFLQQFNYLKKTYSNKKIYLVFATNNIEIIEEKLKVNFNFLKFENLKNKEDFEYFLNLINEKINKNKEEKDKEEFGINDDEIKILLDKIIESKLEFSIIELEDILNILIRKKINMHLNNNENSYKKNFKEYLNNNFFDWIKK